jgi:hypothetical protein
VHVDRQADGRRVVSEIAAVEPAGDGWRVAGSDAVSARAAERTGATCPSEA